MSRPRKDVTRVEIPAATDEIVQERVRVSLPRHVFVYWNRALLEAVVRTAYLQGAMDALEIAEHHPELLKS